MTLGADSLNAIFRWGNQLAQPICVQEVLVHTLRASGFIRIDCAIGNVFYFVAVCSFFELEGFVVAVLADIFEFLVVNLAVGNHVVGLAEAIFEVEFVLTTQTNICFCFISQTVLNVSLIAEIVFFLQIVSCSTSQTVQFLRQVTGHLILLTV